MLDHRADFLVYGFVDVYTDTPAGPADGEEGEGGGAQLEVGVTFGTVEPLKIWRARIVDASASPGTLLSRDGGLVVACGAGGLELEELQRAGGRRLSAPEFLRGYVLKPGARLS